MHAAELDLLHSEGLHRGQSTLKLLASCSVSRNFTFFTPWGSVFTVFHANSRNFTRISHRTKTGIHGNDTVRTVRVKFRDGTCPRMKFTEPPWTSRKRASLSHIFGKGLHETMKHSHSSQLNNSKAHLITAWVFRLGLLMAMNVCLDCQAGLARP